MKHQNQSHTSSSGQASLFFSSPLLGTQHPYPSPSCTWPRSTSKRSSVKIPHGKSPRVFLQGRRGSCQFQRRGRGFSDNSRRSETAAGRSCTRCGSGLTRPLRQPSRSAGPGGNARSRRRPRQSLWLSIPGGASSESSAALEKEKCLLWTRISSPALSKRTGGRSVGCASTCLFRQRMGQPHLPPRLAGADQLSSETRSSRQGTRMPRLLRSCQQETRGERLRGS